MKKDEISTFTAPNGVEAAAHDKNVKAVQGFGYTKSEASNILEGKNADGSDFEELPF